MPSAGNVNNSTWYRRFHAFANTSINTTYTLGVFPYFRVFRRSTLSPFEDIANETDDTRVPVHIQNWVTIKKVEAQYVQVAGAVTFASVISCLSWSSISSRHWTAAAFWYCSILLAITSVVTGATQVIVLDNVSPSSWQDIRNRLTVNRAKGIRKPNRVMLFAWQCPMMNLNFSLIFFLGGLMSYVYSPLIQSKKWDGDAKTAVLFSSVVGFIAVTFWISKGVHLIAEG